MTQIWFMIIHYENILVFQICNLLVGQEFLFFDFMLSYRCASSGWLWYSIMNKNLDNRKETLEENIQISYKKASASTALNHVLSIVLCQAGQHYLGKPWLLSKCSFYGNMNEENWNFISFHDADCQWSRSFSLGLACKGWSLAQDPPACLDRHTTWRVRPRI